MCYIRWLICVNDGGNWMKIITPGFGHQKPSNASLFALNRTLSPFPAHVVAAENFSLAATSPQFEAFRPVF
jgi:hypothetical protein